jgi:D-tyrosyl-tRNA(Tyr) deacylase
VAVDGQIVGRIERGIVLLAAVHANDTPEHADFLAAKCAELRIFPDEQGKMNLSVQDVKGGALVISQFTLYGDCGKGRRPSYHLAAPPELARGLYEHFVAAMRRHLAEVQTGIFAASMQVELVNDGPVTLILEK